MWSPSEAKTTTRHHEREINIDTGLDDLRRNEQARHAPFQPALDLVDNIATMRAAQQSGEVQRVGVVELVEHGERIALGIEDGEGRPGGSHLARDIRPRDRRVDLPLVVHAA